MKKLFLNFSWFALILMIALSCTKIGKNITVKGRVINPVNNKPIAGITVFLYKNYKYQTIKKTVSDENGYFELNAAHIGPVWAQVNYEDYHQYYNLGWNVDGNYFLSKKVDKGKVMHIDYHLVPYGEYRIKINNINCQGTNDTLIINQTNQTNSFLGVDWVLTGCDGYTTSWDKVPMGTIHTKYTVIRNGISNSFVEDFKVLPNQQNEQIINY